MLSISIVVYKPNFKTLERALDSIFKSLSQNPILLEKSQIIIIDNGNQRNILDSTVSTYLDNGLKINIVSSVDNIGYGKAHNLAILNSLSKYHLILNPDVILSTDVLMIGLEYLEGNEDVAAINPKCFDDNNKVQYIAKTYPNLLVLLIRGVAPNFIKNIFVKKLSKYEVRKIVDKDTISEIEIMSGCFMLCRTEALKKINGFDDRFFLYFEDFALSIELRKLGKLMYIPSMKIIHLGGHAARKGMRHIFFFISSGIRFFKQYGWKFL